MEKTKRVKIVCGIAGVVLFCVCIAGAVFLVTRLRDSVPASLGKVKTKEFYSSGGVQDYTDYAKYTFDDAHPENSEYFVPLTEEGMRELLRYLDDFEGLIETLREIDPQGEPVAHYDFDRSLLSSDDYLYLYIKPDYPEYGYYKLYYFDTETQTLFYFHNNV